MLEAQCAIWEMECALDPKDLNVYRSGSMDMTATGIPVSDIKAATGE